MTEVLIPLPDWRALAVAARKPGDDAIKAVSQAQAVADMTSRPARDKLERRAARAEMAGREPLDAISHAARMLLRSTRAKEQETKRRKRLHAELEGELAAPLIESKPRP